MIRASTMVANTILWLFTLLTSLHTTKSYHLLRSPLAHIPSPRVPMTAGLPVTIGYPPRYNPYQTTGAKPPQVQRRHKSMKYRSRKNLARPLDDSEVSSRGFWDWLSELTKVNFKSKVRAVFDGKIGDQTASGKVDLEGGVSGSLKDGLGGVVNAEAEDLKYNSPQLSLYGGGHAGVTGNLTSEGATFAGKVGGSLKQVSPNEVGDGSTYEQGTPITYNPPMEGATSHQQHDPNRGISEGPTSQQGVQKSYPKAFNQYDLDRGVREESSYQQGGPKLYSALAEDKTGFNQYDHNRGVKDESSYQQGAPKSYNALTEDKTALNQYDPDRGYIGGSTYQQGAPNTYNPTDLSQYDLGVDIKDGSTYQQGALNSYNPTAVNQYDLQAGIKDGSTYKNVAQNGYNALTEGTAALNQYDRGRAMHDRSRFQQGALNTPIAPTENHFQPNLQSNHRHIAYRSGFFR